MQVSGSRGMCILKFKDIPKRLYQHTSPNEVGVMKGEMGSPGGKFLLMNNCSEPMHIATVLSFVISLKGNWVGGKPGKVYITKNHNQNFLSLSLDFSSEASVCHVSPLPPLPPPPRRQTCAFAALWQWVVGYHFRFLSDLSLAWYLTVTEEAGGKSCFWQRTVTGKRGSMRIVLQSSIEKYHRLIKQSINGN